MECTTHVRTLISLRSSHGARISRASQVSYPTSLSREIPLAEPSGVAMYGSSAVTSEYRADAAAAATAIRRAPSEKVDRSEQRTGRGQTSLRIPILQLLRCPQL